MAPTLTLLIWLAFASPALATPLDSDGDYWPDSAEAHIGTDPQDHCGSSTTDGWPPDVVRSSGSGGKVDLMNDIFGVAFHFGEQGEAARRWSIGPIGEPDLLVDLMNDIFGVAAHFGECSDEVSLKPRLGSAGSRTPLAGAGGVSVNLANGNVVVSESDALIAGKGLALPITRNYNSQSSSSAGFGKGWKLGIDLRVHDLFATYYGSAVALEGASGTVTIFKGEGYLGSGDELKATGVPATLLRTNPGYELIDEPSETRYTFNSQGHLTEIEDRFGHSMSFYPSAANPTQITDTLGHVMQVSRSGSEITRTRDHTGRQNTYSYSGGRLSSHRDPLNQQTSYVYDSQDRLYRITDALGQQTRIDYDTQGRAWRVTVNEGGVASERAATLLSYYATPTSPCSSARDERKAIAQDPEGRAVTYCIDSFDQVSATYDAAGGTVATDYTDEGYVDRVASGSGSGALVTEYSYDAKGNLTHTKDPEGADYRSSFGDPQNPYSPTERRDPTGLLDLSYDPDGNLTQVRERGSEATVGFDYTAEGLMSVSTDPNANKTFYDHWPNGSTKSVTPPAPLGQLRYTYDSLLRVKTATDGRGITATYTYDVLDRAKRIDYADGSQVTVAYDAVGNLKWLTDPNGTTTYTRDGLYRVKSQATPGDPTTTYTYNKTGQIKSLQDDGGTVSYRYGNTGRLDRVTEPGGYQTAFDYDSHGRLWHTNLPNGVTETRTYDDSGNLKQVTTKRGATTLQSFAYTYKTHSGVQTNRVETVLDQDGRLTTYRYDSLARLESARTVQGGVMIEEYIYTRDPVGNIRSKTETTPSGSETTTYVYNNANQLEQAGSTTYIYDGDGNVTWIGSDRLTYNAFNQTTNFGGSLPMKYSGAGQSLLRQAGSQSIKNDQLGVGASGSTHYTRAAGCARGLIGQRKSSGRQYYLSDAQGSVTGVTDDNGNLIKSYRYDPYGKTVESSGGTSGNSSFKFAAGFEVTEGVYHSGGRFYLADTGRFTQSGSKTGNGDYSPAGNDPVNRQAAGRLGDWIHRTEDFLSCMSECRQDVMYSLWDGCLRLIRYFGLPQTVAQVRDCHDRAQDVAYSVPVGKLCAVACRGSNDGGAPPPISVTWEWALRGRVWELPWNEGAPNDPWWRFDLPDLPSIGYPDWLPDTGNGGYLP
ncbi:hypothetical protein LCGC14_1485550 [marine sediment metagenome]|uniref:RHS repeat protein n=1 Tax=marine sediment metagenome TaxID=412755 RepID=A0A0F9MA52_9ZZZZ